MRRTVGKIVQALERYAQSSGMGRDDYGIFVRINEDWGQLHVVFAARRFPIPDPETQWLEVTSWLEEQLPELIESIESMNLSLRTFAQLEEGGIYGLGPEFQDASEFRASPTRP